MWKQKRGHIDAVKHRIDLIKNSRPFQSARYRAGPNTRELEELKLQEQFRANGIEPAAFKLPSPVLAVPKKYGSFRFGIDYRRLNKVTIKDTYPLPRIDECVASLGSPKNFSTLDANSSYWQFSVKQDDGDKLAFVCHAILHRYKKCFVRLN